MRGIITHKDRVRGIIAQNKDRERGIITHNKDRVERCHYTQGQGERSYYTHGQDREVSLHTRTG